MPPASALDVIGRLGLDPATTTVMCAACWDGQHGQCEQACQCTHQGTGIPGYETRPR